MSNSLVRVSVRRRKARADLLRGRDAHPSPSPSFQATFSIPNHSFTGLRVNQLKVTGDVMYKPFKGVRQVARAGKIDFRW